MYSHKELIVWQRSVNLVTDTYKVLDKFPKSELFWLTDQIKRAIISIASNIAEWSARWTEKEQIHFLYIARGSCAEVDTQLLIAKNLWFISHEDYNSTRKWTHDCRKNAYETYPIFPFSLIRYQTCQPTTPLTYQPTTMEFLLKNSILTIESEKKTIEFTPTDLILDGMPIEIAGEYEKWGFLLYVQSENGMNYYHFRVEGYWVVYIPTLVTDISGDILEFLGNVDILVMPGARTMHAVLEKIEPRLLVTYGESAHDIALVLGAIEPAVTKYRVKEADLSSEKTGCVVMGEV